MKKSYIEILRLISTLAVVMIHVTMTEVVNSTIEEIGRIDYAIYSAGYALSRWAVPVFIMITGSLLLNPEKEISSKKLRGYIVRMILVLATFGTVFSAMEIIFSESLGEWYLLIPKSILRVIENQSWDHLWYIYLIIGLYLLTPFTKAAIKNLKESQLLFLIILLYIINYVCPAFNIIFNINISDFWIAANGYYAYYLTGYYLSIENNRIFAKRKILYIIAIFSMLFMIGCDSIRIILYGAYSEWLRNANPLVPLIAVAVFVFIKSVVKPEHIINNVCSKINYCSFGIYLIHPFFINIIYKVIGITPRRFPIILGIFFFWILIFGLSWLGTLILKKVPGIRNLV